jgi:hypothetical protein
MDAVQARLNFKFSALRIALSAVITNVSYHQVILIENYFTLFQHIKRKLHYTKQVG